MTTKLGRIPEPKAHFGDHMGAAERSLLALDALSKLYQQFANKPDFHNLIQTLLLTLSGQFAVASALAILRKPGSPDENCAYYGTGKYKKNSLLQSLVLSPNLVKYFLANRSTHLVSDFDLPISCANHGTILHNNSVQLVYPLIHNDNLLGIIGLGERVTRKPFSPEDIELLSTMINTNTPLIISSYHFWEMTSLSAWYLDILNNVKQGVFVFDQDNCLRKVNTVGLELLDKFRHETLEAGLLNGLPGETIFPREVFPEWSQRFSKANVEGRGGTIENLIATLDGVDYMFDGYVAGISSGSEYSADYIVTIDDVTERKRLEIARHLRFERVKRQKTAIASLAIEESLVSGKFDSAVKIFTETMAHAIEVERASIWLFDDQHSEINCIDLFEKSNGKHSSGVTLIASDYPLYFQALKTGRAIDAGSARQDPRTREFADGYLIPLGITSMLDAAIRVSGEVVGVVCLESIGPERNWKSDEVRFAGELADQVAQVLSIAERKQTVEQKRQLQEKLEKAEKMESLGILAGGVAHDLNNMLGPLVGYPELILKRIPEDSPVRKLVHRIGSAARSAADVIQDLLTLARRGRYEMQPMDLNEVIDAYLDSPSFIQLTTKRTDISVKVKLDQSIDAIFGSAPHLSKVVMNLITNAFDAMSNAGSLGIETTQLHLEKLIHGNVTVEPGPYIHFKVRDTGEGISAEDQERIFEPYYSKKKMRTSSGSGLGLSVVYGILKDHGGYYDILSTPGEGTEFILYFPVTAQEMEKQPDLANLAGGTERVLIVDDSLEQRETASELIASLGYAVDAVSSGSETLEFLQKHKVDIVVLDMIMEKDFDGLDTFRAIIKLYPGQKAIIVSGFSRTERVDQTRELGAGPYIKKPYTLATISNAIRKELDKRSICLRS